MGAVIEKVTEAAVLIDGGGHVLVVEDDDNISRVTVVINRTIVQI
jgi:hypothetical protein